MKELTRTKRLIIATTLFVFIILIGLVTFRRPDYEYKVSTRDMASELVASGHLLSLGDASGIRGPDDASIVLIDLRNPYEYDKGSIENAINIPVSDILDEEYMDFFRELDEDQSITVLFSNNERVANGAWMFLRQLGFRSFKVLEGGYECLASKGLQDENENSRIGCSGEEPILDYAAFMEETGGPAAAQEQREPITIQPVKRTKKTTAEGGC